MSFKIRRKSKSYFPAISYRPDLDGLRFLAVFSVFFYHLNILNFQGGFLGVDIFFVISGFLITKIISNKFDLKNLFFFLYNRSKRLLPSLYFVCLSIFLAFIFFLPDYLLKDHFINFYSSIFGFFNFNLISQGLIYFRTSSSLNPFLHIWSLSVEIQFYIIFCIFFFVFKNFSKNSKLILIILIAVLSFLLSLDLSHIEIVYYLTPVRIFEFSIGSIAALLNLNLDLRYKNILSFSSLCIIAASLLLIDKSAEIPGYLVLLPCTATFLLILCKGSFFNIILGNKIFSYLGKLSYSIYLIHWPLIVFMSFFLGFVNFYWSISILIITILLSILMHEYLELPLKKKDFYFKIFMIIFFLIVVIISINNSFIEKWIKIRGNKDDVQSEKYLINYKKNNFEKIYLEEKKKRLNLELKIQNAHKEIKKNAKILIIGDSHADDIFLGLLNNHIAEKDLNLVKIETICYDPYRPVSNLSKVYHLIIQKKKLDECLSQKKHFNQLLNNINYQSLNYIVLSNRWNLRTIDYFPTTLEILNNNFSQKKIIIMRNNSSFLKFEELIFSTKKDDDINRKFFVLQDQSVKIINNKLKEQSQKYGFEFFNYNLCYTAKNYCKVYNRKENTLSHFDSNHYSLSYSTKISFLLKNYIKM
jgi:peptidoglycan/LPS O-acetylase OafA/YrhL